MKTLPTHPRFQQRKKIIDNIARTIFLLAGLIAAAMIVLIFIFVARRGIQVFLPGYTGRQDVGEFLTGMRWRPDLNPPVYSVAFIVINTITTAIGAGLISFPISVLTALFIVKVAPKSLRILFTTVVEILAAIPSVVYGVFAAGTITTLVTKLASLFGETTKGGSSMLAVILLLAIMIFPTITSLSIVAISSVDKNLEHGSLALGASRMETNFKVVLTSAKSGIFAGLILGLGRAFGEATAVTMVAGNKLYGPTWNLFDTTRTLTTTMLSGLSETAGVDYDIRFSIGIVLMIVILITNLSIRIVKSKIGGVTNE
jgi:phosphate transport system permease protein